MAGRARAVFQVVVWFAAANFAALVVAALAALVTGAVSIERVGGAGRVLGGSSSAVPVAELATLRAARAALQGKGEEATLVKAVADLTADRADFDAWKDRETAALRTFADRVGEEREAIAKAQRDLDANRREEAREREQDAQARRRMAADKVTRVYRYMRPAEVARDLEARLAKDRPAEVAELLRAMNDRAAAEVLEAIVDPGLRMRIYDALAGITRPANRP